MKALTLEEVWDLEDKFSPVLGHATVSVPKTIYNPIMREITTHKLNGLNDALTINVLDVPGQGGAHHEYEILGEAGYLLQTISFQNGPIKEFGVNGTSGEALIAILIDRLECFQKGPFASDDNAKALTCLLEALYWLQKRTKDRLERGVEGTNQK